MLRNTLLFFLLSFAAAPFRVAAQPSPVYPEVEKPFRVVVIGSSTAAGTGANPIDSAWVNRYEAYLKKLHPENQLVNLARGGYQTYHLLPTGSKIPPRRPYPDTLRNITQALALLPDAIIVNLPSNDAAAGYGPAEQLANFEAIALAALSQEVPIWFTTTQPRDLSPEKIALQMAVRDSILRRYPDRSINFWQTLAGPDGRIDPALNSGDGIHVNNTGHALLFDRVRALNMLDAIVARQKKLQVMEKIWAQAVPLSLHTFRPPPPKPRQAQRHETVLLQAGQPLDGVSVEVYNATGQLVRRQTANLPVLLKTDFGPKGVYRISLRKGSFSKVVRYVKT